MRLDDVAAVQEGHLAVGFDPHLVAGVLCQDGEGGDVEAEFEGFGELSWGGVSSCSGSCSCSFSWQKNEAEEGRLTETGTEGEELMTGDRGRQVGDGKANVVAARLVKTENISVGVWRVVERRDEVLQRGAGVVGQLGEEDLSLFFCERAHVEYM